MAADCDIEQYPMVIKDRERLAVSKQKTHKFHMEILNLKKLKEVEDKEEYWVKSSNRCVTLENFDD
jgi:hypothetical protein